MNTLKIQCYTSTIDPSLANCQPLGHRIFTFAGGEEHAEIVNMDTLNKLLREGTNNFRITAYVHSSTDLVRLALLKDALDRAIFSLGHYRPIELYIPYLPYARQDRVSYSGVSFSLKVIANWINQMDFTRVIMADVHSDVALALINNSINISAGSIWEYIIPTLFLTEDTLRRYNKILQMPRTAYIVAPDAGATKRCESVIKHLTSMGLGYGPYQLIQATKNRNPATGSVDGMTLHYDGKFKPDDTVIVIDDICDGGRTFVELGKLLEEKGHCNRKLYVTHGIFSKGLKELSHYYNHILTTNSWFEGGLDWRNKNNYLTADTSTIVDDNDCDHYIAEDGENHLCVYNIAHSLMPPYSYTPSN